MLKGNSADSFSLMFVRVVTLLLGLLMTRVLSEHFSLQDYGTYSQIMLLITTISSMTMLGMMDGINFFFCKEKDEKKRNAYISTIFFLQYVVSTIVSLTVLLCAAPISKYFGNDSIKSLIAFAALLPVAQNTISLLQIMFIAIGRARKIAIRNLVVSVLKLVAITLACYVFNSIVIIFLCQAITDLLQIAYFVIVLNRNRCRINILKFDRNLIKEILAYCIPMAMFTVLKSLNRDSDKYIISFFTNTETLAIYTNASKLLPFDIIMTSFCTVLLPYITRYIANKRYDQCRTLYKAFLELSYIATTVLAVGAICVAPELMRFLYTDKYTAAGFSISVFTIYILVDVLSVMNVTLILSAAGKTRTILLATVATFITNVVLNIVLFFLLKETGPAVATLIVTAIQGVVILSLGAKELGSNIYKMIDFRYMFVFFVEVLAASLLATILRRIMINCQISYVIILFAIYALFVGGVIFLNKNRLLKNLKTINESKEETSSSFAGNIPRI